MSLFIYCISSFASADKINKKKQTKKRNGIVLNTKHFRLRLLPRAPEQIAAFYYGRGFPKAMVEKTKNICFITVGLHNKSKHLLYLDFTNWIFSAKTAEIKRHSNTYWINTWKRLNYPAPSIATFRWTTLPESFEFQPDEHEGGNILLQQTKSAFDISATLYLIQDKKKIALPVSFKNVRCAQNSK